jgi:signal transduction histidine kinase
MMRTPRPTARLRLTALYGGLLLVCTVALAGATYLLMIRPGAPRVAACILPTHLRVTPAADPLRSASVGAAFDVKELLTDSGIALGIVGMAAFAIGWLAAGQILRPLATITAATRQISATSLHERLCLSGPDDELKDLGDTLDGLFDRLEASFEAQRHFVANASHELRTPISRERTMLQVALDDPDTTAEDWRRASQEVLVSNAEQERLIEALLTLAASESGLEHIEPVDLAAVTDTVLLDPRPETGRLSLHIEASIKPAILHGDTVLAERLVANLIDNAVRHNVPQGHVRITTGTSRGRAVLSVSSTGPVIPPGQVDRLFQPFQRLRSRTAPGGNGHGLGLSIVRAIAAAHDATITAQPLSGGGLTVTVTFPAPPVPGTASPPRTRRNRVGRGI